MNREEIQSLQEQLRAERRRILDEVAESEAELEYIHQEREPELVERGQEASREMLYERLDARGLEEINQIDGALQRIVDGTYGTCLDCAGAIGMPRLQAVPSASLCIGCARSREGGQGSR